MLIVDIQERKRNWPKMVNTAAATAASSEGDATTNNKSKFIFLFIFLKFIICSRLSRSHLWYLNNSYIQLSHLSFFFLSLSLSLSDCRILPHTLFLQPQLRLPHTTTKKKRSKIRKFILRNFFFIFLNFILVFVSRRAFFLFLFFFLLVHSQSTIKDLFLCFLVERKK